MKAMKNVFCSVLEIQSHMAIIAQKIHHTFLSSSNYITTEQKTRRVLHLLIFRGFSNRVCGFVYFCSCAVNGCQSHSVNIWCPRQERTRTNCGLVPLQALHRSLLCHYRHAIPHQYDSRTVAKAEHSLEPQFGTVALILSRSIEGHQM